METIDQKNLPVAPILAIDLGEKRVGLAISDALSISITRLAALRRTNWKQMLRSVDELVRRFDAKTVVIGFPLQLNGFSGDAAENVRGIALKFARSLSIPVYLQDERLTSVEAEENLRAAGHRSDTVPDLIDSEAAAVILRDFLVSSEPKIPISPAEQTS